MENTASMPSRTAFSTGNPRPQAISACGAAISYTHTLPPHPPSSTGYQKHEAQSSTGSTSTLPPRAELRQNEAFDFGRYRADVSMEEDDEEHQLNPEISAHPRRASSVRPDMHGEPRTFPYKLYRVLEDEEMSECIVWYQDREKHGIFIPDTYIFVLYVFPKYFPRMKEWGSFHKQLTNYGFEKSDWNPTQGIFFHPSGMFRPGCKGDLSKVRRTAGQNTTATPQNVVREQPPTPGTSVAPNNVPQRMVPENNLDMINWLVQKVLDLEKGQYELKEENTKFKERQDKLEAENSDLKEQVSRLKGAQARHLAMDNRVGEVEIQPEAIGRKQSPGLIEDDSFHSAFQSGSATPMFDHDHHMAKTSGSSGFHHGWASRSQNFTSFGGDVPDLPYQNTTIDPASISRQPIYSHPPAYGSSTHVNPASTHAGTYSTHEGPPSVFLSSGGPAGPNPAWPQISDPKAGDPLSAYNVSGTVQRPTSPQAFNEPRSSGGRPNPSMAWVPTPSPPPGTGHVSPGPSSRSAPADASASYSFLDLLRYGPA